MAAEPTGPAAAAPSEAAEPAGDAWLQPQNIPALVRRFCQAPLDPATCWYAVSALSQPPSKQHAAVIRTFEAAGGIPALVQFTSAPIYSEGDREAAGIPYESMRRALGVVARLASSRSRRADAIVAAGGVAPLVRLMSSGWMCAEAATRALLSVLISASDGDAAKDAVVAAGGIPAALSFLSSGANDRSECPPNLQPTIQLLCALAADSPARQQAMHEAGGIAALLRSVQGCYALARARSERW